MCATTGGDHDSNTSISIGLYSHRYSTFFILDKLHYGMLTSIFILHFNICE